MRGRATRAVILKSAMIFLLEMWKVIHKQAINMMEKKRVIQEQIDEFAGTSARKPWVLAPKMTCCPKIKTRIYGNRNAFFEVGNTFFGWATIWGHKKCHGYGMVSLKS